METKKYELMLIFHPDLGETKTTEELNEIRELMKSLSADIYSEDIWGVRELAYRMKKVDEGYYAVLYFEIPPENVKELDQHFNIQQSVLRYLVTRTPDNYSPKTLKEYQIEEEAEEKIAKDKKDKKRKPERAERKAKPERKKEVAKKEKNEIPVEEIEEVPEVSEEIEIEKPKKNEESKEKPRLSEEDEKTKLSEVDEKLKSIINDPDITL